LPGPSWSRSAQALRRRGDYQRRPPPPPPPTVAAATAAAAEAATRTTTAAARTTATTAAAAGAGTILRFVDAQRTSAHVEAVQRLHGALCISLRHLDEAEAARPTGFTVGRQSDGLDGAMLREEVTHFALGGRERQVAHVNLGHSNILRKKTHNDRTKKADTPRHRWPFQGQRTGDPCHLIEDVSA
jgi:hypothetical protein